MAKRTNRVARGLVVVLSVVVLIGGGMLFASHQRGLLPPTLGAAVLRKGDLGFGWDSHVLDGEQTVELSYGVRLGFFSVWLNLLVGRR